MAVLQTMSLKRIRTVLVVASLASYAVACATPALHLAGTGSSPGEKTSMSGLAAVFAGFFAVFGGQFAWLANPVGLVGLVQLFRGRSRASLILCVMALVVAQHTWALVGKTIDGDEGGVTKYLVISPGLGFYLWLLAFVLLAVASLICQRRAGEV